MELYFPLILDGATGTQLQKLGYHSEKCTEEWVLEHPETICQIHDRYIENGSQVVYAPTFGANRVKLEENGIFNQVEDYNLRLATLAKENAGGRALVAGDMAPTGKFLTPMGDMPFEEMVEIYTEQAAALEKAGVDLFAIETMMTLPEARAAVLAVRSVSKKPICVTFTCDAAGKSLTGTDVTAALVVLQGMGIDAFGLNCSVGPEDMLRQIKRLSDYAQIPLIAKPNAGMPETENGKTVYRCSPEEFTSCLKELGEAGVALYGGCCGTTEAHIRALYDGLKAVRIAKPQPKYPNLLPLATEKVTAFVPADILIRPEDILSCDESLTEALEEEADKASPVTAIRIKSEEELADFEDNQFAIDKPLCLVCEDAGLLEEALRLYQGRAMYEGNLPEAELEKLSGKYGLVY